MSHYTKEQRKQIREDILAARKAQDKLSDLRIERFKKRLEEIEEIERDENEARWREIEEKVATVGGKI